MDRKGRGVDSFGLLPGRNLGPKWTDPPPISDGAAVMGRVLFTLAYVLLWGALASLVALALGLSEWWCGYAAGAAVVGVQWWRDE
jgi:polyferredoxin